MINYHDYYRKQRMAEIEGELEWINDFTICQLDSNIIPSDLREFFYNCKCHKNKEEYGFCSICGYDGNYYKVDILVENFKYFIFNYHKIDELPSFGCSFKRLFELNKRKPTVEQEYLIKYM